MQPQLELVDTLCDLENRLKVIQDKQQEQEKLINYLKTLAEYEKTFTPRTIKSRVLRDKVMLQIKREREETQRKLKDLKEDTINPETIVKLIENLRDFSSSYKQKSKKGLCGKINYVSEKDAKDAATRTGFSRRIRCYSCWKCNAWHITSAEKN